MAASVIRLARAMCVYQGDRTPMFRIHGTTESETIGHAVSSGCIRLINQDVIDLYNRVKIGAHVKVIEPIVMSAVPSVEVAN
jgi:lipoprotein-anchoring transpeptidase ErfK/SrfK